MDAIALAPECKVAGRDLELSGEIWATTTHFLLMVLLAPLFTQFRYKYPGIVLDVAISNQLAEEFQLDVILHSARLDATMAATYSLYRFRMDSQHRARACGDILTLGPVTKNANNYYFVKCVMVM